VPALSGRFDVLAVACVVVGLVVGLAVGLVVCSEGEAWRGECSHEVGRAMATRLTCKVLKLVTK
jgi:hypothetical protein